MERCVLWTITAAIFCKLKVHGDWHTVHPSSPYRKMCRLTFSTTWHCLWSFHLRHLTAVTMSPNHPRNPSTYSPHPGACVPAIAGTHAKLLVYIYIYFISHLVSGLLFCDTSYIAYFVPCLLFLVLDIIRTIEGLFFPTIFLCVWFVWQ